MRIRNGFEEFLCLSANLSNDNIIFSLKPRSENGYGFWKSGLKTGVKNYIFWSEIGRIWRTGRYTRTRIPRSTPRVSSKPSKLRYADLQLSFDFFPSNY